MYIQDRAGDTGRGLRRQRWGLGGRGGRINAHNPWNRGHPGFKACAVARWPVCIFEMRLLEQRHHN